MRMSHQLFRQKNPPPRRRMTGKRKELHEGILRVLRAPNPKGKELAQLKGQHTKLEPTRRAVLKQLAGKAAAAKGGVPRKAYMTGVAAKWNLLGELNRRIAEGKKAYIPVRDVVRAQIEGHLSQGALDYSLSEALNDLNAAEIAVLRTMLAREGEDISPEIGEYIRTRAKRHPIVRAARSKVEKAEKYEKESAKIVKASIERERRGDIVAFRLGDEKEARAEADRMAKKDTAATWLDENKRDLPRDEELWNKVVLHLAKRYAKVPQKDKKRVKKMRALIRYHIRPGQSVLSERAKKDCATVEDVPYVPPRLASVRATEVSRVKVLANDDYAKKHLRVAIMEYKAGHGHAPKYRTVSQYRGYVTPRICKALQARWRSAIMNGYERKGGKYLEPQERRMREAAIKKEVGAPYPLDGGYVALVEEVAVSKAVGGKRVGVGGAFSWTLVSPTRVAMMSGDANTKGGATRAVNVAQRIAINLSQLTEPGFDNLPAEDRKWLENNQPRLARSVRRKLLNVAGQKRDVIKKTALWLARGEEAEKKVAKKISKKVTRRARKEEDCRNMSLGEGRSIAGKGYHINVTKRRSTFAVQVVSNDGLKKSPVYRFKDCDTVLARGHVVGGALMGARKVIGAMSNPASLRRLHANATRNLKKMAPKRKKNPIFKKSRIPREAADVGTFEDLSDMISLPSDPEQAYRLGYYAGIIKGIDTCGVQNYLKRRRLRDEYEQRLIDAALTQARTLTGTGAKRGKVRVADVDIEEEFDIEGLV